MAAAVLITGGSGLLALNWALAIRERHPVTLGIHERAISLPGVQALRIDLESVDQIVHACKAAGAQTVIHTAGLTSVEKCEAQPEQAQHINVNLVANVAHACAKLDLQLVHISTDHLFSGDQSLVNEIHPVAPRNVYGRTKAESEARVLEIHPPSLVVRTNFYGWGPRYRRSFSDLVIDALRSGRALTLFRDVFYTPVLIETVAQAAHDLIELNAQGVFHVVGDERISKYEFGRRIAEKFKLDAGLLAPGALGDQASLVQRPHDMSLSNEKARSLLGRKLGGVDEHIARLQQQERDGLAEELHCL